MAIQLPTIHRRQPREHWSGALADSMVQAAQMRRQKEAHALAVLKQQAELKRQEEQDFQQTYLNAGKLAQSRDLPGAQALMSRYGGQQAFRETPGKPAQYETETIAPPLAPPNLAGLMGDDPNAMSEQMAAEDFQASNKTPTVRQKMVAAAQAGQKIPILKGQFAGRDWSIDPEAQQEARGARFDEAMSGLDDATRAEYQQIRPALMMSNADVDTTDLVRHLGSLARERAQGRGLDLRERGLDQKDQQFGATFEQRDRLKATHDMTAGQKYQIGMLGAQARSAQANRGSDASERGWRGQASTTLNRYLNGQSYQQNVGRFRAYSDMLEDMKSLNTAQMVGGLGSWIKEKSGGGAVITENEIKRYATSAIPWDERAEKEWDYWMNGGKVDPGYVKPFVDALEKTIVNRQRGYIEHIGRGAKATMLSDPNPEIQQMADSAYLQAITPIMSPEQLESYITGRVASEAQQPAAPAPGPRPRGKAAPGPAKRPTVDWQKRLEEIRAKAGKAP